MSEFDDGEFASDDDVIAEFDVFAAAPVAARLRALPAAHRLLRGDAGPVDVATRVRCCRVLAGCVGRAALEALVDALDDRHPQVRAAAVSALASSAQQPKQGMRLLHALAHPRADVRRAALLERALPAQLLTLLLSDERLRDEARDRLVSRAREEPEIGAVVVRARRQGLIDDLDAGLALRALPWAKAATILRALPVTALPDAAVAVSADALVKHAVGSFDDALVDVIAVVASDDAIAAALAVATQRRALDEGDLRRLAVAIAVSALSQAPVSPSMLAVAAIAAPVVLALDGIDVSLRRAAARKLVDVGVGRHDDPLALLASSDVLRHSAGYDIEAVAGVMRLCAERSYCAVKNLDRDALVRSFARTPSSSLLSLPPSSAPDRLAYLELLPALATALMAEHPSPATLARLVVALPFDGGRVVEFFDGSTVVAVIAAIVDGEDADEGDASAIDEKRLQRACELLCARLDSHGLAGALRLVATSSLGRRARAMVRALTRAFDIPGICEATDALIDAHQQAVLPLILDETPPFTAEPGDGFRALWRRSTSTTMQALLARAERKGGVLLTDEERVALEVIADAHLAPTMLAMALARPLRGLADVVVTRASVPRSVDLCTAVLASHDAVSVVARAASLALPEATPLEVEGVRWLLRHRFVTSALPLCARLFLVDDPAVALRLERDIRDAPGGLKAMIELALALPSPVDAALWNALAVVTARLAVVDRDAFARLVDARAVALLRDLARGEVQLLPADPVARAAAEALLAAALPQDPTTTTETPKTTTPDPSWAALTSESDAALRALVKTLDISAQRSLAEAALLVGVVSAERVRVLLGLIEPRLRAPLILEALRVVDHAAVLSPLVRMLPLRLSTLATVDRLRDLFSWGSRQSVAIVGRSLGMTLIGDSLGYTRLKGSRIYVNPLPLLLGEEDGIDVVKGLIVHELGHHRFHTGEEGLAVWDTAGRERLHKLLNLVADEHLERNLRAQSPRYGDPLKILAAHAFQHMQKEVDVDTIVQAMGPRAFAVLSQKRLGVARRGGSVVLDVGAALFALEKNGSSFARFMRALRMGLGDRYDDPRVREALALFSGKRFRSSDMPELLRITRRLREIFQDETRLLDAFDLHQLSDASADDVVGDGAVDVDDLDRAVAEPEKRQRLKHKPTRTGRAGIAGRVLNDADDDSFDVIDTVERVAFDASAHRVLSDQVRRDASRLRQTLLNLGKNLVVERRRLAGRRLDRTALSAAVLKGDPRLLVSRRILPAADVFIGVAIDCSGSMDGDNLDRARLFGAVIAEAARGLRGVDARFFGFTDTTIFDAGDARRPGVASLVADGGNNDAAALLHVSQVARRSRRKTRLLVMISDGSPTECSVEALRGLVVKLTRQGFLCAQVAVQPLDDICFPHYVLLDDDDLRGAVRGFASVVERLVLLGTGGRKVS